ncbi:hypothetical protein DXG01_000322 [Tephrocybe rancida]|nr:hypothetical protein DXG01_000322 [Tephrocybe rancida]
MRPEPSDTDWIRVTSIDGFSYMVRRKVANVSGTMRNMLDENSNYAEAVTRTCQVSERVCYAWTDAKRESGIIVEKMLEYMAFKLHYMEAGPKEDIPVNEFLERLHPEIVLELLVAADYQEGDSGTFNLHWMFEPGLGELVNQTVSQQPSFGEVPCPVSRALSRCAKDRN